MRKVALAQRPGPNASADAKIRWLMDAVEKIANASQIPEQIAASQIPDGTISTAMLADDAVSNAKLRNSAALSVIGRAANSTGDPGDIAAAANDRLLARTGDALAFGQLTVGMAPDDLWTYAKLQNVSATSRLLGRATAGAGDIEELTAAQAAAIIGANGQIPFPASQNASADANTLDDYEEGTWTPTLTFATAGDLSVVYSTRVGVYTKIGRLVIAQFTVVTSTFTHTTAAGDCQITGLPVANGASVSLHGALLWSGITKAGYTAITARVSPATSMIVPQASGSGVGAANVAAADMPTAGTVILAGSAIYID